MRRIAPLFTSLLLLSRAALAQAPERPAGWVLDYARVASGAPLAADGITLLSGIAGRPDLRLKDGTIEFDLAPTMGSFAGVAFRMASAADYEILQFQAAEDGTRWANLQYQPVFQGETTWQLYHGPGYEATVPAWYRGGDLHVRLVVAGTRADVFLRTDTVPVLRVERLQRAADEGGVGFWVSAGTGDAPMALRHLVVQARPGLALAPIAEDPTDRNELIPWRLSPRMPAASIDPPAELPAAARHDDVTWVDAEVEPSGLINLDRQLGNPAGPQPTMVFGGAGWGIAYARVRLVSERVQTRRLSFSYSDGIGVYVDGRRVFVGRNDFGSRYPGYLGIVGKEADAIDLPLKKGVTEVVLAITDRSSGWGFRARLDSLDGISLAP